MRAWVRRDHGVAPMPADIEIATEPGGRPMVAPGPWAALGLGGAPPAVALTHAGGAALAAAAHPGRLLGIDMEVVAGVAADLLAEGAFGPEERALIGTSDAGLVTAWCAKEAAAKATGQGLTGRPKAFVLTALTAGAARVEAPGAGPFDVSLASEGDRVMALALG